MNSIDLLYKLSDTVSISGFEENAANIIENAFKEYVDEIKKDKIGNLYCVKRGTKRSVKVMITAHMDEIGLMVKDFDDNGFIIFRNVGGVDPRTLLSSEVIVHGKEKLFGVVGTKPIHLQDNDDKTKSESMDDLIIDVGLPKEKVEKIVEIGDLISLKRKSIPLRGNIITGKAFDDKAGISVMYESLLELNKIKHEADVYYVSTVQEEVGLRGSTISTYKINPDIGIAIDVGFGHTEELSKEDSIELGKGPAITIGGNIHPKLREKLVEVAKEYNIPFQYEIAPGSSGTDAWAMQITRAGIPCLLISLPLRYMHTTVETIDINDIKNAGKLIARFISNINEDNLEELLCY